MPRSFCLEALCGAARRLAPRLASMVLLLPLATTGCGNGFAQPQFPPPCPQFSILPGGGDLQRWRGQGQDITDQILVAQVMGMGGTCAPGGPRATTVHISVHFNLDRGPAAPGRVADLPWFLAVTRGDTILDRQEYVLHAPFPPNTDHLALASDPITLKLPISANTTAAAYTVYVSFQLSPQDVAVNRAHPLP